MNFINETGCGLFLFIIIFEHSFQKFEKQNIMKKYDAKKDKIKEAGIKSFAAYGFQKTTLEDIAEMLGMKKNSLYYYFESKEALFHELIEDELNEHLKLITEISSSEIPADKKLKKAIDEQIQFVHNRLQKYAVKLSSFLEINRLVKTQFQEFQKMERGYIESILKDGIKNGIFRKHDTTVLAQDIQFLIPAIFRGFVTQTGAEFVSELDFSELSSFIQRLISNIINGIKKY